LVHLSGGFIEMHVDFFVLIVIVTLYADWIPFLLAIGYVVAEHVVVAFTDHGMISDYPDLHLHPGMWIIVHGGFILAAAVAGLVHWRIDESANVEEALKARDEEQQAVLSEERRARAATEVALRAREELLSIVSHDLKDPLGAIKGNAQLLQRHVGGDNGDQEKRVAAGLTLIDVTATRMAELLDELLDVTRLATGNVPELQRHPTDLVALTRRVAADYQKTAARERINVASQYPTLVGAWDGARLERAIANLVLRAILRSPAGGRIDLDLLVEESARGVEAVVIVRDRPNQASSEPMAPGIDRFHRVAGTTGLDVGVVVAGQIVEQHGGRIDVTVEENEWSVIRLNLPVASPNERKLRATSRGT
jgi:signal transduction histidine kinase